jgi:hypothetical protein
MLFRRRYPVATRSRRLPAAARRRGLLAWILVFAALIFLPGNDVTGDDRTSRPASPPRNRCTPDPGHVDCLDDHAGLIHGAVIRMPSSRLTCRAFRQLWMRRYKGKDSRAETREVVVAGVCEQTRPDGTLIRRWSSVDRLPIVRLDRRLWSTLDVPLPQPVVRLVSSNGGERKSWIWSGYYLPRGWNSRTFLDPTAPADFNPWSPLGAVQAWTQPPAGSESVESPLFDRPVACTAGYVVCSPYLSILHPHPASTEVRVEMVSARRYFSFRTGHPIDYLQDATLLNEVFTDP